jgi:hypothetical protein
MVTLRLGIAECRYLVRVVERAQRQLDEHLPSLVGGPEDNPEELSELGKLGADGVRCLTDAITAEIQRGLDEAEHGPSFLPSADDVSSGE